MARKSAEERFIEEYLVDRDPIKAAQRAGVAKVSLKSTVKKWMSSPDVRRRIDELTNAMDPNVMIKPQWVISKFQEIASSRFSSPSAKNTALRELATIAKMYPEKGKGNGDEEGKRSNILLVPGEAAIDNWEKAAMKQQKALKDDVRN